MFTPPKKGERRGGRQKGTPNKLTATVKSALAAAFEGIGGVPALIAWAKTKEGRPEFYKLWAKMMPTEVTASVEVSGTVSITVNIPNAAAGEDRSYRENAAIAGSGNVFKLIESHRG